MGSKLVDTYSPPKDNIDIGGSPCPTPPSINHTDIFNKAFPYYLSIGMTYELYWNNDCELVKHYREASEMKKRAKNEELWLQGLYFYEALCDVSPVLHAFAKRNTKPIKYPSEPYPISEKEAKERAEEKDKKNVETMRQHLLNKAKGGTKNGK